MPNTCICARLCIFKAVVIGLKGDQFDTLKRLLEGHPITVRNVSPAKLLRLGGLNGLVVLTRFVKHKHSDYAEQIATGQVVRVPRGAASAVADAIIEFFGLTSDEE